MIGAPGAVIREVRSLSIGEEVGLHPGDRLLTVDGRPVRDILDYRYLCSGDSFVLEVQRGNGEIWEIEIEKEPWEDLGLEFDEIIFDGLRLCQNRCLFCFLSQMPPGLRSTLYLRDDDYRLSFLHGNFITLTGVMDDELERIISQHLSPLYVSVHATDEEVRRRLFGSNRASGIMGKLRRLAGAGIELNAQVVLCPNINDGAILDQTLNDLLTLGDRLRSVGVVPVGLTKYRAPSSELRVYTPAEAGQVIDRLEPHRRKSQELINRRRIYVADEFFVLSGRQIPRRSYYEGYPQLENGIGLIRRFLDSAGRRSRRLPAALREPRRVTVVTGCSAAKTLASILEPYQLISGLTISLVVVKNRFFGPTVTVAGLLTGEDIAAALAGVPPADRILVPAAALRDEDQVFLDGLSLTDLSWKFGQQVLSVEPTGPALARAILEE